MCDGEAFLNTEVQLVRQVLHSTEQAGQFWLMESRICPSSAEGLKDGIEDGETFEL